MSEMYDEIMTVEEVEEAKQGVRDWFAWTNAVRESYLRELEE